MQECAAREQSQMISWAVLLLDALFPEATEIGKIPQSN